MRIVIGLLLIVICFGSDSCQKELTADSFDSTIVAPPGSVSGSFTAKVDGVQFVADKATGITRAVNRITITGLSNDGQLIALGVADSGVHVYTLDIASVNFGAYSLNNDVAYTSNGGSTGAESGGTLSVTAIDAVNQTMSGTFTITVFRQTDQAQKIITEGVFNNISYSTTAIPPSNSTDTFRVKVDSVQFPVFSVTGVSIFSRINLSASDQMVSKMVGISMPSNITPGGYTFTIFGFDHIGQYNVDTSYMIASSGTLTILEHNTTTKRIRGNFTFSAEDLVSTQSAVLTEGYFSVVYQ